MSRPAAEGELSNVAVEMLLTLLKGPRHGYAVKLDIQERIGGDFILGSGSLYQALQRLERRALESELARMDRVMRTARLAEAGTE